MNHWSQALDRPREELRRWAERYPQPGPAWEACPRADWLVFGLAESGADRPTLILCACDCAEQLLGGRRTEREALESARSWARTLGSAAECRRTSSRLDGPGSRVAYAATLASRFWEMPRSGLGRAVEEAVRVDPPDEERELQLVALVQGWRWPLRQPSSTEILRAEALAVVWDRLSEEVEPSATLTTLQALSSFWTALELGMDLARPLEWEAVVIRAVAERLQLAPQRLPEVKRAIVSLTRS